MSSLPLCCAVKYIDSIPPPPQNKNIRGPTPPATSQSFHTFSMALASSPSTLKISALQGQQLSSCQLATDFGTVMSPLRTNWKRKNKFPSANELWKGHFASFSKELPPRPSPSPLISKRSTASDMIFNSVPCLTGRDRTNYLLVKEAKIIAMTCTHAALKRRDLVELGFKVKKACMIGFQFTDLVIFSRECSFCLY